LMADEPQVVERLQMVARRSFPPSGSAAGHEVRVGVADGGPGGCGAGEEVERGGEGYKA
jgi:hypothetical protein